MQNVRPPMKWAHLDSQVAPGPSVLVKPGRLV